MRVGKLLGYGVIVCLWTLVGSAWAQSDPPTGVFPSVIGRFVPSFDTTGVVETYNLDAPTVTKNHPFFESLGTNGRACATCHEPRSAWGVSTASIQQRFAQSGGTDPIFRPIDGATCPSDDVSTLAAKRKAYNLLLTKGLIRIFLPLPASRDFNITALKDLYGCTTLNSSPPVVSVYRRPLPATSLEFLLNSVSACQGTTSPPPGCTPLSIMWDGREPSLQSQAIDATEGHAQGAQPTDAEIAAIVAFETNTFDAQVFDFQAGYLAADGATGGPVALSQQEFFEGINDVLSPGFSPIIFTDYAAWENLLSSDADDLNPGQASVARGEILFNTKTFTINGVNGLNLFKSDPLGANNIVGTCGTCHDSPNVGNHSLKLAIDIGVPDAAPPALDISGLPLFTVTCTGTGTYTGAPPAGYTFQVTDLGKATISGHCADVGKVKGPLLRGLAARAPYFQNGSAGTLLDVVNFYDLRFAIGFTDQEKADLVAFLQTL
jgi:cytochrome c peroxidase